MPSQTCLTCDVCCRFLDSNSHLAPIFTDKEYEESLVFGLLENHFVLTSDGFSHQIQLKPHQDMFICPAFNPETQHCTIYQKRPLDCQIYPFMLMWSVDRQSVLLVVDRLCPYTESEMEGQNFKIYIDEITEFLESIGEQIAQNYSLIGPFQGDVFIVRQLEQLTQLIGKQCVL